MTAATLFQLFHAKSKLYLDALAHAFVLAYSPRPTASTATHPIPSGPSHPTRAHRCTDPGAPT